MKKFLVIIIMAITVIVPQTSAQSEPVILDVEAETKSLEIPAATNTKKLSKNGQLMTTAAKIDYLSNPLLSMFTGKNIWYMIVPIAVICMFLISGVAITVILARERWKEGIGSLDKKIKNN